MDRTALLASLGEVTDTDNLELGDGRYIDWSNRADDGRVIFVAGAMATGERVDHEMTYAEMVELHKRLTLWLLAN